MDKKQFTSIGGQAVIEGVMMRSPHFCAIAVRKPDQKIIVKEMKVTSLGDKYPLFKKPFIRGVVGLFESMIKGMEALSYSANVAIVHDPKEKKDGKEPEKLSKFAMASSIFFAFAMGMGLFVAAPHYLTLLLGDLGLFQKGIDNPFFHLIDGIIKVSFLLMYVYGISLMKDVYRVFQYHGAEHKSIYTFEQGKELTINDAKPFTSLHPRCGTSFLLFLLVISILVFSVIFPFLTPLFGEMMGLPTSSLWVHLPVVLTKIILMLPVAGVSYEFIKLSATKMDSPFFRALVLPGLLLQKLTTREPDSSQLEVALVALRRVLYLEKHPEALSSAELEVGGFSEISSVSASVAEFPEM